MSWPVVSERRRRLSRDAKFSRSIMPNASQQRRRVGLRSCWSLRQSWSSWAQQCESCDYGAVDHQRSLVAANQDRHRSLPGSVCDVEVVNANPSAVFEAHTISAVSRWRYAPVLRDGQPIAQRALIRVSFYTPIARASGTRGSIARNGECAPQATPVQSAPRLTSDGVGP